MIALMCFLYFERANEEDGMEKNYLNEEAMKALVHQITAETSPECRDDRETLESLIPSFHAYVDAVVRGETDLLLNPQLTGKEYQDMVSRYDQKRHNCHETAMINARVLNRLAERYQIPPVFTGDSSQRHQVAVFCLELDQYLFVNRRMKLS